MKDYLRILFLYGRGNDYEKDSYRETARNLFRKEVIKTLTDNYDFYKLEPKEGNSLKDIVEKNFKTLLGKIYQPKGCSYLILALEKDKDEKKDNDDLLAYIDTIFIRTVLIIE